MVRTDGTRRTLLEIEDLSVRYRTDEGAVHAVEDVDLAVGHGETFGLVGESGCGKTTLGEAILGLVDGGTVIGGSVWLDWVLPRWRDEDGRASRAAIEDDDVPVRDDGMMNLLALDGPDIRQVRWNVVSLVPQSAMNALNPVYTVGDQIVEALALHRPDLDEPGARERARELLAAVGIDAGRADDYAHQLSGGQRQRAVIAMAMACDPDLVIADEPTTALDVIVQDRVLDAIDTMRAAVGASTLLVSHDVGVISETCDRVGVMYAGRLMESGTTREVLEEPANPYTLGLRNAFPAAGGNERLFSIPGAPPTLVDPEPGCRFADRCPFSTDECADEHPPMYDVERATDGQLADGQPTPRDDGDDAPAHRSACHRLDVLDEMRRRATEEGTWNGGAR